MHNNSTTAEARRVGDRLVRRVGVGRGEDVLVVDRCDADLASLVARAGGCVVEWTEVGDLPFADGTFDIALATFELTPVCRPAVRDLVRVLRSGGRLGAALEKQPARELFEGVGLIVEVAHETDHVLVTARKPG